MANKAMLTNLKSSLGLTKRPNVWLNIHTRTEHKMLHKKKISRIRRRREKQRHEIKINIYLMFLLFLLLYFSSFSVPFQNQFFCNSLLPQCLFPTPTSHSSIPKKKPSPPQNENASASLYLLSIYPLLQVFTCSNHQPVSLLNHHHGKVVVSMATRPSMLGSSRNQSPLFQNCCQLSRDCGTW